MRAGRRFERPAKQVRWVTREVSCHMAKAIVRETAKSWSDSAPLRPTTRATMGRVKVSHGERVIDLELQSDEA